MTKNKILIISAISVMASLVTFVCAHIVWGVGFVLDYFISVFVVSIIPMWNILYILLRKIFAYYYSNCVAKIFKVNKEDNITDRIFGINAINLVITISITAFILICYIYFVENGIIFFPQELDRRLYRYGYCLGIIPSLCGSFAGAIAIRTIYEAWNFLKNDIYKKSLFEFILLLKNLKKFLDISIISTYMMCIAMYLAVFEGPYDSVGQPLILFLVFLALWPLAVHIFCRIYLTIVSEKCFEKFNYAKIKSSDIKEEIRKIKNMSSIFAIDDGQYKNLSMFCSLVFSVSQIIIIFLT